MTKDKDKKHEYMTELAARSKEIEASEKSMDTKQNQTLVFVTLLFNVWFCGV